MMRWLGLILALTAGAAHAAEVSRPAPLPFQAGELWGYRNADGSVAIAPRFYVANAFTEQGSAAVATDNGWVIIDRSGKVLLRPFVFDNWPDEFSDGFARFVEDGKIGFFDRAGRKAIPARFDAAYPFSEGLAAVCRGCRVEPHGVHSAWFAGRWGYVDRTGKLAVPYQFERAGPFQDGRAEVDIDGRRTFVDTTGHPAEAGSTGSDETRIAPE